MKFVFAIKEACEIIVGLWRPNVSIKSGIP